MNMEDGFSWWSLYQKTKKKCYDEGFKDGVASCKNPCSHEWHADQDNDCNFCVKCGARQEIYVNDN